MLGAFQRVDWYLVDSLAAMARPWFQTNHWLRTKHRTVYTSASVEEGCTRHPGCLALSEGRMN